MYDVRPEEGEFFTDNYEGIVINRKMADLMGGEKPIGKYLSRNSQNMKIVGVLDNFKFNDFKAVAQPLVIFPMKPENRDNYTKQLSVRISGTDLAALYETVRQQAAKVFGEEPVVRFLDDNVQSWLMTEKQSARMVSFFTLLAIIISCLGLFGLATFMIEQKRKEIGVRRVNGAKVTEIVWLLNIGFMKPILMGFVVACPLAYYFMNRWLESYLQRTEMSWWIFIFSGVLTLLVALSALLWRTVRAAMENPVHSLRSE
nr:FtsX-like permease family protein [Odoribacter sp. OF09-27XD]